MAWPNILWLFCIRNLDINEHYFTVVHWNAMTKQQLNFIPTEREHPVELWRHMPVRLKRLFQNLFKKKVSKFFQLFRGFIDNLPLLGLVWNFCRGDLNLYLAKLKNDCQVFSCYYGLPECTDNLNGFSCDSFP